MDKHVELRGGKRERGAGRPSNQQIIIINRAEKRERWDILSLTCPFHSNGSHLFFIFLIFFLFFSFFNQLKGLVACVQVLGPFLPPLFFLILWAAAAAAAGYSKLIVISFSVWGYYIYTTLAFALPHQPRPLGWLDGLLVSIIYFFFSLFLSVLLLLVVVVVFFFFCSTYIPSNPLVLRKFRRKKK